ncbi:hypothetical protein ALP66_102972 [Pseudomonas amygdali pv. photiniae]|uniref:Uncharacterized protein n=3 Tax=Pseudomonas syringae group genomosp. 2 TaxID=251698 RepID=A0A3M6A0Y1_PSESS|nr:Unknown protein sequence [Pseudomonas amygdali pv. myricae]KPX07902.1 Unknown protein sequence [Pseudomonas syringae pv. cunninghamiae]KPX32380.1 hypothetical protein ALO70_102551 [Pseudomonas amygdali pv. eriobotryae]KPX58536.1 Unknown protein sequence [Pseudomonas amygdali pv. photiniae]KPY38302.1 Unknown protein sequence [Pseudomonas syringae pv. rhaphiolepidis]RMO21575.1 hypothetical protein ALQ45_102303 [Pseudomonas amygdali pv. morsprunorum]RMV11543.1 hypothetical protein ALP17_11043
MHGIALMPQHANLPAAGLHAIFCKERPAFEWDVAYLKVR